METSGMSFPHIMMNDIPFIVTKRFEASRNGKKSDEEERLMIKDDFLT